MAQMPIEIVEVGDVSTQDTTLALSTANKVQKEFLYQRLGATDAQQFNTRAFKEVEYGDFLAAMQADRKQIRGYHPYVVALIDSALTGDGYSNLYWGSSPTQGLAVFTTKNIPDVILPRERMASYILYHLAFTSLHFLAPGQSTHKDSRNCVFDFKEDKRELLKSMKARAICDECRKSLLAENNSISPAQFFAIDGMFEASGRLLSSPLEKNIGDRPRAFVGSSREGLPVARKLQFMLDDAIQAEVWDQGTVFGLGEATLESLEQAVLTYQVGIFVFTPDDELHMRETVKPVARDNVVFELGLFVGKLTRSRAFVVQPRGTAISLPSDLSGIATAQYEPNYSNLAAALGPACEQIREAVRRLTNAPRSHAS